MVPPAGAPHARFSSSFSSNPRPPPPGPCPRPSVCRGQPMALRHGAKRLPLAGPEGVEGVGGGRACVTGGRGASAPPPHPSAGPSPPAPSPARSTPSGPAPSPGGFGSRLRHTPFRPTLPRGHPSSASRDVMPSKPQAAFPPRPPLRRLHRAGEARQRTRGVPGASSPAGTGSSTRPRSRKASSHPDRRGRRQTMTRPAREATDKGSKRLPPHRRTTPAHLSSACVDAGSRCALPDGDGGMPPRRALGRTWRSRGRRRAPCLRDRRAGRIGPGSPRPRGSRGAGPAPPVRPGAGAGSNREGLLERFALGAGFSAGGLDFAPAAVAAGDVEAGQRGANGRGSRLSLNLASSLCCPARVPLWGGGVPCGSCVVCFSRYWAVCLRHISGSVPSGTL